MRDSAEPLMYPPTQRALGPLYTKEATTFRVWAPTQPAISLALYDSAQAVRRRKFPMKKAADGVHEVRIEGDLAGYYYSFLLPTGEVSDPYGIASAKNSARSAIIDLRASDPSGFRESGYVPVRPAEAILYELHVGDFTYSRTSENPYRGKYLAFTQQSTSHCGVATGLAHLKELGITHVHLMPVQDFLTVDESRQRFGDADNYNWGYDPELFNVPEGAYSVDPEDPALRVKELKRLVQSLHEAGIGVVMDVVYNHTYRTEASHFNQLVPGYYYRMQDGKFSNGSGCGNELKTENPMVRRFLIDSLLYWQQEYKIDGFRFDLMALLDRQTIREAAEALQAVNPYVILYGEPWMAATSPLPFEQQPRWLTQNDEPYALFHSAFRDAMRGDNDGVHRGFVQGLPMERLAVEMGLVGSIDYDDLHRGGLKSPLGSINYFNAHDNLILEDKLLRTVGDIPEVEGMTRLAFGLLLTAQGIPFFHAGNEFRRSKQMDENSYASSYAINAIDWERKERFLGLSHYVRDLIRLRKQWPVFRLECADQVRERVHILEGGSENIILILYDVQPEEWLLCIHNNAWTEKAIQTGTIRTETGGKALSYRLIFDQRGAVQEMPQCVGEGEELSLRVAALSTTIYHVQVGGNDGLQTTV